MPLVEIPAALVPAAGMARGGFIALPRVYWRLRSALPMADRAALFIPEFAGSLPADRAALTPLARSLAGPPVWCDSSSATAGGPALFLS
jgi:hypothetical protein